MLGNANVLTIACVLRSGGDYTPHHVDQLRDSVARNLSLPYRFVCLSDMEVDCERIPLKHKWEKWFSKMELFRPDIFDGPVFYSDLDTLIVGSLDDIVLGHRFTVLRNFWAEEFGEPDRIGSGLMAWDAPLGQLYHRFAVGPAKFIREYKTKERWGDQAFIKVHTPLPMERWQDKFPGKVVSFKKHVLPAKCVPAGAAIVAFHGPPRPWALTARQRAWFEREREVA